MYAVRACRILSGYPKRHGKESERSFGGSTGIGARGLGLNSVFRLQFQQQVVLAAAVALREVQRGHLACVGRRDAVLDLHRLDHGQKLAPFHAVPRPDGEADHLAGQRRAQQVLCLIAVSPRGPRAGLLHPVVDRPSTQ